MDNRVLGCMVSLGKRWGTDARGTGRDVTEFSLPKSWKTTVLCWLVPGIQSIFQVVFLWIGTCNGHGYIYL